MPSTPGMRFWPLALLLAATMACQTLAAPPASTPTPTKPSTQPTTFPTVTPPGEPETSPTSDCVQGYITGGGDTTPPGLQDAPRTFVFNVQATGEEPVQVSYVAYPPSPSGDARQFDLDFHAGSVLYGDYLEACGTLDTGSNTVQVNEQGDYIVTQPATTVLLVRHAEKASQAANTNLSATGLTRAGNLSEIAVARGVGAVYTTDYCRTAQTGQPAAAALGLSLQVLPSGDQNAGLSACNPPITVPRDTLPLGTNLAQRIQAQNLTQPVLVVGHSNTIPALVQALGAGSLCPEYLPLDTNNTCNIPEAEYDHLFTVYLSSTGAPPLVTAERYAP